MNTTVGKGAIILTISGLVCKLFGALFRLPLTNIIGLEGIALFQMVITIYSFALVCVSGGVTNSLSKLISSARARGDQKAVGAYLRHALHFTLGLSLFFGAIFLLFAPQIVSLQRASSGEGAYRMLTLLLPLGGLVGVFRGILQGYGNMTPTAVSQIIEQVVKFAFGLIFAYLFKGQGIGGGVLGAVLGITISEVFACFYLGYKMSRVDKFEFAQGYKKRFFEATLPLTFGGVILPLTHTIEALFIVKLFVFSGLSESVAKVVYGLQTGVVGAILNFPLVISLAVASALLPNLSYLAEKGDDEGQREVISKSLLAMWFLLIPLVVGIMSVARNVYPLIYPQVMEGYLDIAVQLTFVNGFSIIATALMQQLVSILQANGYFKDCLIFYVIGGTAKLVGLLIIALIPSVAPFAIAISNLILSAVVSMCVVIKLKGLIALPLFDVALPLLASFVMFIVVRIILSIFPSIGGLALAICSAVVVYLVLALPLTGKYAKILTASLKKGSK
ncbi:MAG: oligosaccharide flippase family protein [Clostridia bacterium]|nr:oligosaccharide flippase family protein [Clostridia bacterium]